RSVSVKPVPSGVEGRGHSGFSLSDMRTSRVGERPASHGRWSVINSMRFSLAAAALLAAAMVVPGPALAQDSPQFNNWGPGMPPPDDEGVDDGSSSAAGPDSAAPYAAPAPGPIGSGCSYDLRGMWRVQGQWSYGGSSSYSATVSVRQFHRYLPAIQDDGTSYYGMCTGSQVQFDVYSGYQYAGRQYGSF